ncbi:monoamine oxidase, partial [Rhodococcus hoagii]|nr:monoamine oxidase [Prescottella equi]
AWVGPGQDRILALMSEFGVCRGTRQYTGGDAMMVVDGRKYRYQGTIPMTMSPWAVANLGTVFLELGELCKTVPLDAPWEAKRAVEWDRISLAKWLDDNVLSKPARANCSRWRSPGATRPRRRRCPSCSCCINGVRRWTAGFVLGVADAAQDSRPVAAWGDLSAHGRRTRSLPAPFAACAHDRAGRLAVSPSPPTTCRSGRRGPSLRCRSRWPGRFGTSRCSRSTGRSCTSGCRAVAIRKISVVYDEPFWRADGLSGQSAAPDSPAMVTIDAGTDAPRRGVLCVIVEGPRARELGRLAASERRTAVLGALAERFGHDAATPVDYIEQDWSAERYSGGGMLSHAPTGVLTEFGPAAAVAVWAHHPLGRHGESAVMCGWVDGAVRSGERAAREVLAADDPVHAGRSARGTA